MMVVYVGRSVGVLMSSVWKLLAVGMMCWMCGCGCAGGE